MNYDCYLTSIFFLYPSLSPNTLLSQPFLFVVITQLVHRYGAIHQSMGNLQEVISLICLKLSLPQQVFTIYSFPVRGGKGRSSTLPNAEIDWFDLLDISYK